MSDILLAQTSEVCPGRSARAVNFGELRKAEVRRRSPVTDSSVLEEGHKLAQRFKELVGVGAGVDHQVSPFLAWQVVEAGLMVAKEHQDVVECLVVTQLVE
jgi:hypothetical protein